MLPAEQGDMLDYIWRRGNAFTVGVGQFGTDVF